MKNLKIRYKLAVTLGAVTAMLLFTGYSGFTSVSFLANIVESFYNGGYILSHTVIEAKGSVDNITNLLGPPIFLEDDTSFNQSLSAVTENEQSFYEYTAAIAESNTSESVISLNSELVALMSDLQNHKAQLVTYMNNQDYQSASDLFLGDFFATYDKMNVIANQMSSEIHIFAESEYNRVFQRESSTLIALGVIIAIGAALAIATIIYLTKSFSKPIAQANSAMASLAAGDFNNINITYEGKDEFGEMANNIKSTINSLNDVIDDISSKLTKLSNGNFVIDTSNNDLYKGEFAQINSSISIFVTNLSRILQQVSDAASQVSAGSDQVSAGAQVLAEGSSDQANSLQTLSTTVNDISMQVSANAENSNKASEMANGATHAVTGSNNQMQELMASMMDIDSKSKEISKIIKTIEDIAFQTNILALNAAVEAARAGAAGKGFAVVADEVRNLAAKSAEAAKNTTTLIQSSIQAINSGVNLAKSTADNMVAVLNGAQQTTELVSEISAATNEQAETIKQITMGLEQIFVVVQTNTATSEESAAASEQLSSQANLLKNLVSDFTLDESTLTAQAIPPVQFDDSIYSDDFSEYNNSKY